MQLTAVSKGKVERGIRDRRFGFDPKRQAWSDLAELQEASDVEVMEDATRRICPATGTTVRDAWEAEKMYLAPLPILPEPFHLLGQSVEVRGCAGVVQVLADTEIVAVHQRGTPQRVVIDPSHYEGPSTTEVQAPMPLGRMGTRIAEIAAMIPERRPLDLYAALAEAAR